MSKRFLELYNQELRHVRESASEFAAAHPKIAKRLSLDGGDVEDPYVERMLEGFAFLSGRVQHKLEAEFPRFTQHLLNIVYPHFGKPTPSYAVVQFQPSMVAGNLSTGYTIARRSRIRSHIPMGEQTACEFVTAHEVELWPLEVHQANYLPHMADLPPGSVNVSAVRGGLRIVLKTTHGIPANALNLTHLDVHFASSDDVAYRLFDLCIGHAVDVVVCDPARRNVCLAMLGRESVKPIGFNDEDGLIPFSSRSFGGYRLLLEYFAFPGRYLFARIDGLADAIKRVSGDEIEINILFRKSDPGLAGAVKASDIGLFCTPAINLFQRRFDRIPVAHELTEFHVVVDRQRPADYEVYDITEVEGYDQEQREMLQFQSFYRSYERSGQQSAQNAFFSMQREMRLLSSIERKSGIRTGYAGSEVYLSLVDRDFAPFDYSLAQLGGSAWVTNRDLPTMLQPGHGTSDFALVDSAPVGAIRCVRGPTKPVEAVTGGTINWQLISHLSLNFLALDDESQGSAASSLRELLSLYADRGDVAYSKHIESIQGVSLRQVVRRVPHEGPIIFGRGIEFSLKVEESAFSGASVFLFGMVIERFIARHAALNTFTETVLQSVAHGEIYRWQPRIGDKPLI